MNELLMEPPDKLRKLNDVRRSLPHCTASALAAIVNAVRAGGLPEGRLHRHDFRAARDYENKQLDTKFLTPPPPVSSSSCLLPPHPPPHPSSP